jgi:NAD(P)-dependent dehydrogenase (short-subunit alcohol dehydrogenase family)
MQDALGYAGRNVVVTGAASGMGRATAEILVDLGAIVTSIDIKPTDVAVTESLLLDLRDRQAIDQAVATIPAPVDAVFSCAGLPGPPFSPVDVMLVNFVGPRHLVETLVPKMREGSAIASIASNAGLGWEQQVTGLLELVTTEGFDEGKAWCEAHPDRLTDNSYAFSKQVINAWVAWRSASLIRQGIRLNCINPGPTATPMMPFFEDIAGKELVHAFVGPIGRDSQPEEQAWPLVFLNSPRMSYVTGLGLATDGGFVGAMITGQIDLNALMALATQPAQG